jgi:hypothetical protein
MEIQQTQHPLQLNDACVCWISITLQVPAVGRHPASQRILRDFYGLRVCRPLSFLPFLLL